MAVLVDFAILQMVRTPVRFMKSNAMITDIFPSVTVETLSQIVDEYEADLLTARHVQEKMGARPDFAPFPQFDVGVDVDRKASEVSISLEIARRSYLAGMGRVLSGEVGRRMRGYSWSVIEMPDKVMLPTCDNPFVR